jgi:hypothetical protein
MGYATAVNAEIRTCSRRERTSSRSTSRTCRPGRTPPAPTGSAALNAGLDGVEGTTAVHLCFGYAAIIHERPAGYSFLPELAGCPADQISIETAQSGLDLGVLADLSDKTIILGVLDLSTSEVEAAEVVAARVRRAYPYRPAERLVVAPDCGLKYLPARVGGGQDAIHGRSSSAAARRVVGGGAEMQLVTEDNITDLAAARWGTAHDPRLAEIMQALVRHLHDFAREVRLTEDEWMAAVQWLARTGQISDDKREEFILASDVLGLSMLVVGMNHRSTRPRPRPPCSARSTSTARRSWVSARHVRRPARTPLYVSGTVRDLSGKPVGGASWTCGRPTRTVRTRRSSRWTRPGCGRSTPAGPTAPTACGRSRRSATRSRWTVRSAS